MQCLKLLEMRGTGKRQNILNLVRSRGMLAACPQDSLLLRHPDRILLKRELRWACMGFLGFCCRQSLRHKVLFPMLTGEGPDHTDVQL